MARGNQVRDDREGDGPAPGGRRRGGRWADRPEDWAGFGPRLGQQVLEGTQGLAAAAGGGEPTEAPGKKPKSVNERKREIVNGVEYVRDGSVMFPVDAVMAAGGDFNKVDPNLAISYQGTVNKRLGAGRGFQGTGAWAQGAQAAGLGDVVGAGWTQNSPAFGLVQDLMYGHTKMGVNGTFVEERNGMYNVKDRNGNVISSGQGAAPPELFDTAAQQMFETQARDAILRKGGNLATRLQGQGGGVGTDRQPPVTTAPAGETAPKTQIVNGVQYQLQPDGTWVKIGPAPTGPPQTDPAQAAAPPTTRPYQPAPAPPVAETKPGVTPGIGKMVSTLAPPPTGPVGPAMPKNPIQSSVSSYLGVPKPGESAGVGSFKAPKLGAGPQMGAMPKMPKLGSF